jgi:hypothetical protein
LEETEEIAGEMAEMDGEIGEEMAETLCVHSVYQRIWWEGGRFYGR